MTEPPTPAEVMLGATRSTLRSGRMGPGQVVKQQVDALGTAGYRLRPDPGDGGVALLLTTAKRAFRSGRFRPAEIIALQLDELAAAGYQFEFGDRNEGGACADFVWGPDSFDSCEECGLSFWRHGEGDTQDNRAQDGNEG